MQFWDKDSFVDGPIRSVLNMVEKEYPFQISELIRFLSAVCHGNWPAQCVYNYLERMNGVTTLYTLPRNFDGNMNNCHEIENHHPISISGIEGIRIPCGSHGYIFKVLEEAAALVRWEGLLTESRAFISQDARCLARNNRELNREGLREGASFVEVVKKIKPDIVLLLSAVVGLSSREVLQAIKGCSLTRPAIFRMSAAQCTAQEAFTTLGGNVVFASSYQFSNVDLGNGKIGHTNHVNKMYLFPGITLGTLLSGACGISDGMLSAAATSLSSLVKEEDTLNGILFPPISRIRDITKEVAAAVIVEAVKDPLAKGYGGLDATKLKNFSKERIICYVEDNMWSPSLSS